MKPELRRRLEQERLRKEAKRNDPKRKLFRERVRALRQEKELTQLDVANALEVSKMLVSYWESGRRMPTPDKLKKLTQLLGVSEAYLSGVSDDRTPNAE